MVRTARRQTIHGQTPNFVREGRGKKATMHDATLFILLLLLALVVSSCPEFFFHSEAHLAAEAAQSKQAGTFQLLLLTVELLLLLHQLILLVGVSLLVVPLLGCVPLLLHHHRLSHHLLLRDIPHLGLLRGLNQGLLLVRGETLLRDETLWLGIHYLPGLGLGVHHLLALALTKTVLRLLPHDAEGDKEELSLIRWFS